MRRQYFGIFYNMDTYYVFILLFIVQRLSVNGQMLVSHKEDVIVTTSSQHVPDKKWNVYHVVDNITAINAGNCECCGATTNKEESPWYKLDLKEDYKIQRIHVKGSQENVQYLHNMTIQLGTTGADGTVLKGVDTSKTDLRELNYTLPYPELARFITLTLRDIKEYFIICELYVYAVCNEGTYGPNCVNKCGKCNSNETCDDITGECSECTNGYESPWCKECIDGRYGSSCVGDCGHCKNNDTCEKSNGCCPNGCSVGYQGYTCTQECEDGTYGLDCQHTCGNCFNNGSCNKINGGCVLCAAGYKGNPCVDACENGTFGKNCTQTCGHCLNATVCDSASGECEVGCMQGYDPPYCIEECEDGTYGLDCQHTCGNCLNNGSCNMTNGGCVLCAAGYKGNSCVDSCENGTFGKNCTQTCGHCLNATVCDSASGECEVGCMHGYDPPYCIEAVPLHDESNVPIVPIAGGVGGAFMVIALVAVIVIALLKCRRKEKGMPSSNKSFQDIHVNDVADAPTQKQPETSVHLQVEEHASPVRKEKKLKQQDIDSIEDQSDVTNDPETANVYYSFLSKKSDLKICQLYDYIKFKKTEDCVIFYQEYSRLSNKLLHPYDVAMKPKNREKTDTRVYLHVHDHSRVPLVVEDHREVEYINASFIDGYSKPRKFIASQGPIESMRDDFWRMVWQQKSKSIVMLTNLIENGSYKCILYWPISTKKTVTYGKITIALLSEDLTVDYVIRHMEISKEEDDSTLPVTQFHYKAWPDKSYPDSTWSLVKFWLKVEEDTSSVTESGPIVVHCSAGIGRTGTYIALDNAYYQAKIEGTIRILDVVKSLREQRVGMVQTQDQYVYLHEAVADALLFGTHCIWSSQFEDAYAFLSKKEKGSNVTRLHTQFNIIVESIFDKRSVPTTVEDSNNDYSNVFIQNKPAQMSIDEYRPKSKSLVYVREVGALILQNHEAKDAFIVCKSPTESRMTEFWSLIKEQNVKTIVSLADMAMVSSKSSSFLGLKNKAVQDKFGLSLAEERKTSIFTERQIKLKDYADDTTVFHYEYIKWASGDIVPKDPNAMAQFVEAVLDRQRRLSETDPILVYCNNGTQRCGVMCALLSEVYRMNKDGGNINIIETVKMMKERSDDIIPNVEQYVFINDVILSRVHDHTYHN